MQALANEIIRVRINEQLKKMQPWFWIPLG